MFGLGSWGKVVLMSAGAAWGAPKVTSAISPEIAGAAGGYLGNKNITGAVAGYFLGPLVANMLNGMTGKATTSMAVAGY